MSAERFFKRWRIGVCGSSHNLPEPAAQMCEAIGEELGRVRNVKIVHSGLKRRAGARGGTYAADWHFIEGARRTVGTAAHRERIETMIADSDRAGPQNISVEAEGIEAEPESEGELFFEGEIRQVRARNRTARRFRFVSSLDAMIAVGGGFGTRQQLTLAAAIETPAIPVPCFKGTTAKFWADHRTELTEALGVDTATAERWERTPAGRHEIVELAKDMVAALLRSLPQRCFVIMPYDLRFDTLYDLVIEPAVSSLGAEILRLDRLHQPGTVTQQIEEGIRTADYCIVVLDGLRPNVLYEMGMATALEKPLVVVMQKGALGAETHVPFDISTLKRIEYDRPDKGTLERLRSAVQHLQRPATA